MRYSHAKFVLSALVLLMLSASVFFRLREKPVGLKANTKRDIFAVSDIAPHGRYDTMGDACKNCHDIDNLSAEFLIPNKSAALPNKSAALFCVTCHVPDVFRPNSTIVFPSANHFGKTPARLTLNHEAAGAQPPSNLRLTLNSLGSKTSIYQKNPDQPTAAEHRRGLTCLNCHTAHTNTDSQIRTGSEKPAGAMILKANPVSTTNTTARNETTKTMTLGNWATQAAAWCLSCHPKKTDSTGHNHPDKFCLQCHQDPGLNSPLSISQFPHNSDQPNLLVADPSELCVTCHKYKSLP